MVITPEFHEIDLAKWERKEYFDYYYNNIKCKYTLNYNLDITELLIRSKEYKLRFFPTFLYTIMRAVNQNKEFRMSFNEEGKLGYWNYVLPSYTIFHEEDKTFSDIWSEYDEPFLGFYNNIVTDMENYKNVRGIKARPGRPLNFCSVSSVPWLSFTGFSQDTYSESKLLFPLIRFGKYFIEGDKSLLPFAVFVNHAVADGYHTSKLINDIQGYCNRCEEWIKIE